MLALPIPDALFHGVIVDPMSPKQVTLPDNHEDRFNGSDVISRRNLTDLRTLYGNINK